ncbi:MAG TPA: hypothetical protein VFO77_06550 [Actinoplanes sp.]|nr:hypothetical protein [Actinoplanes sp.]
MNESSARWQELAGRAEALALKLKMHLAQADDGGEGQDALDRLRTAMDEAFEAAGSAFQDDAVREDIQEIGRLFGEAFRTTATHVGGEVRDLLERR